MAELAAAATVVAGVAKMAPKLLECLGKNHKLRADLERQIDSIKHECDIISALVQEDTVRRQTTGHGTHQVWITMVRDLAYEIDDTIDSFTRRMCVTVDPNASWIRRTVQRVMTRNARNKFAKAILRLQKRSEDINKLKEQYSGTLKLEAPPAGTVTYTASPVGMGAAQEELMVLIRETPQGQPKKLRVISIVGFGGIGKTQLVKHVYKTIDESEYPTRAWVTAAERTKDEVLKDILGQLGDPTTISSTCGGAGDALCKAITECLVNKRFLIVIDDIGWEVWDGIKEVFPVVHGMRSRVIVTTARHSIAQNCSHDSGIVYEMRTLDEHHSRQLLIKKASMDSENPPLASDIMRCSEAIKKCDGLPLALVTTGHLLQSICHRESWTYLCENLGQNLEANDNFTSMKRVLVRSYTSLGKQDVRTCLLYLGIYPSGRPIRRASLMRRWIAEGFITGDCLDAAIVNFKELVERSIIRQPVDDNNAEMKTCQTHGIMLEFILHNTDNFVTLLGNKATLPSNVRWLSLHAAKSKMNPNNLCHVRSLTIFGETHKSALDFSKYKLMRVLDLEECGSQLEDKHLKEICSKLLLLRYLSLRGAASITVLPKEIKKLQRLETLDVRGTNIETLPPEVMELPCLVHLFGKLMLQEGGIGDQRISMLQTWLSENSRLKTVAGFVADKRQELPQLIKHMEDLTKLKIWCESTLDATINISHLSNAIKGFVERSTDAKKAHSLSLNFNAGWPQDLLCFSLKDKYYFLRSLKLQGNSIFNQLPLFVSMMGGLTKVCLSFPGHNLSSDILDALSKLRGLEHLKLVANQMEKLFIEQDAFRMLRSLCIVVEVMIGLVISKGALPGLNSLQLLCKDLNGFSSTMIHSLPLLKEVALHDGLNGQTKHDWNEAAANHSKRPKLLFKLMGSQSVAETSTVATATDTMVQDVVVESKPVENFGNPAAPPTDMALSTPPGHVPTEESVPFATSNIGCESAAEIIPIATATDLMTQAVDVKSEHVENSESSVASPMTLSVIMPPKANSNGKSVTVAISVMGSETVAKIPAGPATTDNMMLLNQNTFANAQQEYPVKVVPFEIGSEPAAEILVALSTTGNAASINLDAFATVRQEHPAQADGDGQYDDHGIEDVDSFGESDDFASENGHSTNKERFIGEMEGVAGLEGQQMEDGTQAGEEQVTLKHEATCLVEAALGMLEKAKVRPEEGVGKDVVEAK